MLSRARSAVAPLYLLCCLVLGGSAQGVWQNALLQLLGLAILAWAAGTAPKEPLPPPAKPILLLAIAAVAVVAFQEIPLPASLWDHGVRAGVTHGYQLLDRPLPDLPISLTPYESLTSLLSLIPPLAMFCAIVRLKAFRPTWLATVLLVGAFAGLVLGALQVASSAQGAAWYLYAETNIGSGVGFFANTNHMADLLVLVLPFVAAIAAAARSRNVQGYSVLLTVLAALVFVLIVGIAFTHSLAGYLLAVPAIVGSTLIVLPLRSRWRGGFLLLAVISILAALGALATSTIGSTRVGQRAAGSVQSREAIFQTTARAISDYLPFGTGLGSFLRVYPLYESPDAVTNEYVVHAHDDYAELALELGIPGMILILLFLAWWVRSVWAVWRRGEGSPFTRAASIASAAVLAHSIVDFPLRTAAISTCFAMCLGLLADRRLPPRADTTDFRPTRHIVFP